MSYDIKGDTMKINELLKNIMTNYQNKKITEPFNKESSMFQLINYTSKDAIKSAIDNLNLSDVNLEVKASCGAGVWTRYPWIAVFNSEITTTIQEGIYIVYLFSEDMKRLYLTISNFVASFSKQPQRPRNFPSKSLLLLSKHFIPRNVYA